MFGAILAVCALVFPLAAQSPAAKPAGIAAPASAPMHKYKAIDADNHNVLINKPGLITLLLGTNENSRTRPAPRDRPCIPFAGGNALQS